MTPSLKKLRSPIASSDIHETWRTALILYGSHRVQLSIPLIEIKAHMSFNAIEKCL
jgi:hypothetical protein